MRCRDTSTKAGKFCQYLYIVWKEIKEGRKSNRQLLLWNGRAGRWVAFKPSVFSHKTRRLHHFFFFFFPPFNLASLHVTTFKLSISSHFCLFLFFLFFISIFLFFENASRFYLVWSCKTLHPFFFFFLSFKLKRITQNRLQCFLFLKFSFPLTKTKKALCWAW